MKRLTTRMTRREALGAMGAASAAFALGCSQNSITSPSTTDTASSTASGSTNAACAVSPTETVGPYPSITSLIRSDIREGKAGVPLALKIVVVNASNGCAPVSNANVEVWQCDATGNYSEYGNQTTQTYLRGIQTTDAAGAVSFTTIYPGWYQGRATHIHVEVKINGRSVKVTQIAFDEAVSRTVYSSSVYSSRGNNPTSNTSDMVFSDGFSSELVTPVGTPSAGYSATFQVGVAA